MSQQSMSQLSVGLVQCTLKSRIVGQPFSWVPASSPNDVCCVHVWQCLLSVIIVPVRNVASSEALQYTDGRGSSMTARVSGRSVVDKTYRSEWSLTPSQWGFPAAI